MCHSLLLSILFDAENIPAGKESQVLHHVLCSAMKPAHPQINHRHVIAVSLSDNGCQVLKVWWQEGSVCGGEPHGACLLVTLEVCSADATHISFERGVQCYEMKLDEREMEHKD